MSRETVLARSRVAAQAGMVDTCVVKRATSSTTDRETAQITALYTTVYSGQCKVRQKVPRAQPQDIGQAQLFVARLELHVPIAVTGVASDDLVTIIASLHDPDLLNRVWHLREIAHATHLSARRFNMIEVTS